MSGQQETVRFKLIDDGKLPIGSRRVAGAKCLPFAKCQQSDERCLSIKAEFYPTWLRYDMKMI